MRAFLLVMKANEKARLTGLLFMPSINTRYGGAPSAITTKFASACLDIKGLTLKINRAILACFYYFCSS